MRAAKITVLLIIILLCLTNTITLSCHNHDTNGPHGSCNACINTLTKYYEYTITPNTLYTPQQNQQQITNSFTNFTPKINTPITQAVRLNN